MNYKAIIRKHLHLVEAMLTQTEKIIAKTGCVAESAIDSATSILITVIENSDDSEFAGGRDDDDEEEDVE